MPNVPGVAIVTGAAQGLGASICVALLKLGYKVSVADVQEDKGKDFVLEQQQVFGSGNIIFCRCDVTKLEDYERTFETTLKTFGRIDVVINNAGVILEQDCRTTINVNLIGQILGCQTAIKYMGTSNGGKGGLVINMSSILGFVPCSRVPAYTASKYGIIGLTRSYGLPYHLEKDGILYAAVCPSLVNTDILKSFQTNALVSGIDLTHRPEILKPDDVVQGVMKILEDRINGSTLLITKKGLNYIGYQDEFKDIPFE